MPTVAQASTVICRSSTERSNPGSTAVAVHFAANATTPHSSARERRLDQVPSGGWPILTAHAARQGDRARAIGPTAARPSVTSTTSIPASLHPRRSTDLHIRRGVPKRKPRYSTGQTIPYEVLELVCQSVQTAGALHTLAQISLTCKTAQGIADPLLYETYHLRSDKDVEMLRSVYAASFPGHFPQGWPIASRQPRWKILRHGRRLARARTLTLAVKNRTPGSFFHRMRVLGDLEEELFWLYPSVEDIIQLNKCCFPAIARVVLKIHNCPKLKLWLKVFHSIDIRVISSAQKIWDECCSSIIVSDQSTPKPPSITLDYVSTRNGPRNLGAECASLVAGLLIGVLARWENAVVLSSSNSPSTHNGSGTLKIRYIGALAASRCAQVLVDACSVDGSRLPYIGASEIPPWCHQLQAKVRTFLEEMPPERQQMARNDLRQRLTAVSFEELPTP